MISNDQKGFTLAELLVAMTLSLIVLGAVHAVYRVQAHTVKAQEYRMEAQEYGRVALDMMVREIRNSGYFPNGKPWPCGGNQNGIVAFNANSSVQFRYDFDADGACTTAGEDITYTWNGSNILRTDWNVSTTPQTLTDDNITIFQLSAFEVNGAATTVPAEIKKFSILLTVRSKSTDTQFNGLQTITMSSNADLRNLF